MSFSSPSPYVYVRTWMQGGQTWLFLCYKSRTSNHKKAHLIIEYNEQIRAAMQGNEGQFLECVLSFNWKKFFSLSPEVDSDSLLSNPAAANCDSIWHAASLAFTGHNPGGSGGRRGKKICWSWGLVLLWMMWQFDFGRIHRSTHLFTLVVFLGWCTKIV